MLESVGMHDRYEPFARTFAELTREELYEILRVRAEIFVVGQRCFYLDPDGVDLDAVHVGLRDARGALAAYARAYPEPGNPDVWRIGRVLAVRRGEGLGRLVMEAAEQAAADRGATLLRMDAQRQAAGFYARVGWRESGPDFDEAGIPHVRMEKVPDCSSCPSFTAPRRTAAAARKPPQ